MPLVVFLVGDGPIGLERRAAFAGDDQRRALAIEPGDLQIPGVESDVGIGEARFGVGLCERAIRQYVVEHHREPDAAELDVSLTGVGQLEAQR